MSLHFRSVILTEPLASWVRVIVSSELLENRESVVMLNIDGESLVISIQRPPIATGSLIRVPISSPTVLNKSNSRSSSGPPKFYCLLLLGG